MICTRCGKEAQELGASINGKPYCHTFDDKYPTCYMIECTKLYRKQYSSDKGENK